MKKVGIVVVTYNRLPLLKEVVEALRQQTFSDYQIIVVNNGSTDDTPKWLQSQNDLQVINQTNVGGAGGFFTGMKYTVEQKFDFCWIMDDDVICSPTALEKLYESYQYASNAGFLCSKVIGTDGCPMNTPLIDSRPTPNGYADYTDKIEHQMIKIQQATFVSVFIPTSVICEVGLPYKEYFIWGDDSEYTLRISRKHPCYMACQSIVLHKRAIQATLSLDTEKDPKRMRNYFYMLRNVGFNNIKYSNTPIKTRIRNYKTLVVQMTKYLCRLRFRAAWIVTKALFALTHFNPQVEYPQNKEAAQTTSKQGK